MNFIGNPGKLMFYEVRNGYFVSAGTKPVAFSWALSRKNHAATILMFPTKHVFRIAKKASPGSNEGAENSNQSFLDQDLPVRVLVLLRLLLLLLRLRLLLPPSPLRLLLLLVRPRQI